MKSISRRKTASWRVLVPVVAVLSILAVSSAHFGTSVFAGDSVTPRTSPPGMVVASEVAADRSVVDALVDGNVTKSEYDRAVNNVMSCLDSKGIPHTTPSYDAARNSPRWLYVVGPYEEGRVDEQSAAYDECFFKYEADIQGQWDKQHQPSSAKKTADESAALQCAKGEGEDFKNYGQLRKAALSDPSTDKRLAVRSCFVIGEFGFDPRAPH